MDITPNDLNGLITISDSFDISATSSNTTPNFPEIGSEYIINITNLQNVKKFTKFQYDSLGLTPTRYLSNYYRVSRDGVNWTAWLDLKAVIDNFPIVDTKDNFFMDVKWVRVGSNPVGNIRLLDYTITGIIQRNVVSDGSAISLSSGSSIIMKAPYIYKVFSISDTEIISNNDLSNVEIKYRYSQDNSRTWSNWEILTTENISTIKINPIRFFQIEYSITNNSQNGVYIQDINLIGDFQNVSQDYFKTNLLGIRECCKSNITGYTDSNGNFIPNTNGVGGPNSSGCSTDGSNLPQLTSDDKSQLYNPYQQNSAMNLLNKLSNDTQDVFGHQVIYFATDPDRKGEDKVFNEYQLYNVVCQGDIKVSVEGNNFPDSQIVMNQFDLNLFETMQVHITKQQFKEIFGPQRRPAKEDFLYFCDINRLFTVDHAQQFRNFNNSAVYYKLILKKFNKQASVNYSQNDEVKQTIDKLTKNSTIDELFGAEISNAKKSIANKEQFTTLSKDPIRLSYNADIDRELIENSSTIISRSNYDLSSVGFGELAVQYLNMDPYLKVSDNLSYYFWFSINNYILDETYNFFTNYDDTTSQGFKFELTNDRIDVILNTSTYSFNLGTAPGVVALEEDVWYCYVVNIDQRQRKLDQWIYKRNCDDESRAGNLISTILRMEYSNSQDLVPFEYLIDYEIKDSCKLVGSDMKATNIRLFNDIIPEDNHNKILNQYIIGDDSRYLIFADNATNRIFLPNFPSYE